MKLVVLIILIIVLFGLSVQAYLIWKEKNALARDIGALNEKLGSLAKENADLRREIEYYSHPENLEKELRSRFNYKLPGEKTLIIVP